MTEDFENIRTRVPARVKPRWQEVLKEHKISQQDAVLALIEWAIGEDPLTRAMVFGVVPDVDRAELTKIVLRRLSASQKRKSRS